MEATFDQASEKQVSPSMGFTSYFAKHPPTKTKTQKRRLDSVASSKFSAEIPTSRFASGNLSEIYDHKKFP